MAYNLATAYVPIVPSMEGVGKAIEKAFGDASKTTGSKTGQSIGKGLSGGFAAKVGAVVGIASTVFSKVASVVTGSLNSAISRADQMNNFPKVMKNLGYSSEDAAASIKKISSALDGLPTTSSAMTGMVQQLAPLTSNLDQATNIALAFNNAMLAGGASTMEQENALTQYTQMLSAGKVDMQAWHSIQAAMPGQLNQVAEAMLGAGKNSNDLYEAMKNGSISFDDFNKKVMELNQNGFGKYASFAQQAKDATQGIGTAMENVQNRVAKAVQKVIEAVSVENIAGAINGFSSQFGKIGDAAAGMVTGVKGWFGKAAQAAQPLVSIWKSDFGQLGMYLKGLAANAQAFGGSLLDVVTNGGGLQNFLTGLNNIISPLVNWWIALTRNVSIFIGTLSDSGGVQAFLASLSELWKGLTQLGQGLSDAVTGFLAVGQNGGVAASIGQLVGDAFNAAAPFVEKLASTLQSLGDWAIGNGDAIRTIIAGIAGGFAAFKTASLISAAVTALKSFDAAAKIAAAGQWVLNAAMNANPIVLVVTAIAALVSALVWFFTQTETGRKAWAAFTSFLSSAWQSVVSFVTGLGQNIANFFTQTIPNAIQSVIQWFQQLPSAIGTALSNLITSIGTWAVSFGQSALQAGQQFVSNIANFLTNLPATIAYWLAYGITFVVLWAAQLGSQAISAGQQFLTNLGTFLMQLPGNIWNWLTSTVASVASWAAQMGANALSAGSQFLSNVGTFISQLPSNVGSWLSGAISAAASFVGQMASNAVNAGSRFLSSIGSYISQVPGRIGAGLSGAISAVGSFASSMASGALRAGQQFLSNLVNTLASIPGRMVSIGSQIVQGIINGITGSIGQVGSAILGGVKDAIADVKNMLGIHSPSRLFRDQIGRNIGLGLAQGISNSQAAVMASMNDMASGVASTRFTTPDVAAGYGVKSVGTAVPTSSETSSGELLGELLSELRALHADMPLIMEKLGIEVDGRELGRVIRNAIA
ncbi:tape measure protein [Bifidobacterium longum]|uniref:tape measure protein n=1 Tax=Bifidobacterium longum TaxID=216816 RepID=UPI00103BFC43|nr:tape measure protein [Bifidobacterium longum]TCF06227.1 phage tail protein [Bifidobacterium longum subsp. longum]TCF15730.1 phage tail protein [Bifidobacterium longum subsp. longum]TCF87139.1 phage tail protein [Bifidobacterium longum subsp. longum]